MDDSPLFAPNSTPEDPDILLQYHSLSLRASLSVEQITDRLIAQSPSCNLQDEFSDEVAAYSSWKPKCCTKSVFLVCVLIVGAVIIAMSMLFNDPSTMPLPSGPAYVVYNATVHPMDPQYSHLYMHKYDISLAYPPHNSPSLPASSDAASKARAGPPASLPTAFVVGYDGLFHAVGTDELLDQKEYSKLPTVDMEGRSIFPGFIDSHAHLVALGIAFTEVDVSMATDKDEVVHTLQQYLADRGLSPDQDPGYFIMGGRWDQTRWHNGTDDLMDVNDLFDVDSTSFNIPSSISSATADADGSESLSGSNDDQEHPFPTAADLDAFFPQVPLVLMRVDYHAVWVNSAAMRVIGDIPDTDPEGGVIVRDDAGKPTGVFLDNAIRLFTWHEYAHVPKDVQTEAIKTAVKECNRNGVTMVHDALVLDTDFELYRDLIQQGRSSQGGLFKDAFPLRVYGLLDAESVCGPNNYTCPEGYPVSGIDVDKPDGRQATRLEALSPSSSSASSMPSSVFAMHPWMSLPHALYGGSGRATLAAAKLVLDGALGSWGASMQARYSDKNTTGIQLYSREVLETVIATLANQGYQVATHAIGDKAVLDVVDALDAVITEDEQKGGPGRYRRHRVEHLQIAPPGVIERLSPLGILASMQSTHATSDMVYAESRVGAERLEHAYSWREVLNSTNILPMGTDFPIEAVNPMRTLHAAVTMQNEHDQPEGGWLPDHTIDRYAAVRAMTWDGAFAAQQEHLRGSITVGKSADFVVMDRDLLQINATDIMQATVLGTFIDGNAVFIHSDEFKRNLASASADPSARGVRPSTSHWSALDPWVFAPLPSHVRGPAEPDSAAHGPSTAAMALSGRPLTGIDSADETVSEKFHSRAVSQLKTLQTQHIFESELLGADHDHAPHFARHVYESGFQAHLPPCVRHAPMMYLLHKENYVCPLME